MPEGQRYTEAEAISLFREHCREYGAQARFAKETGLAGAYINQWAKGTTTASRLPDSLLAAVGLRRITYIERIPQP